MAALVDKLISDLQQLSSSRKAPAEPPRAATAAASGLLRLLQQASSSESAAKRTMGEQAMAALTTATGATCVCRSVEIATAALDDQAQAAAAAGSGSASAAAPSPAAGEEETPPPWSRMRADALLCLLEMASSEERCVALVEQTDVASVCLSVLNRDTGEAEAEAVHVAANVLRNLALPLANRPVIGALRFPIAATEDAGATRDATHVLLRHVGHRVPSTAALVAGCLRVLTEKCVPNARRFASAHAAAPHDAFVPLLALRLESEMRVGKPLAFARVDLCRFVASVLVAVCDVDVSGGDVAAVAPGVQRGLVSEASLGFAAFLLSTRHASLHREGCAALLASTLPFGVPPCTTPQADADDAPRLASPDWPGHTVEVAVDGEMVSLSTLLRKHVAAGSLTMDECAPMLRPDTEEDVSEVRASGTSACA